MTAELRPYPEYKDSGLPWLGRIPKHWVSVATKRVCHIQTGVTLGKKYEGVQLEERPYLRVANVQNGYLNLNHIKRIEVPHKEAKACELRDGDVVVTEGGDIDKLGRGAVWRGQIEGCIHQNHIFAIRPQRKRLTSRFLSLVMESIHGRSYLEFTAKRTTNLASTNRTTLGEFRLFLPPPEEQTAIANVLGANGVLVRKFIRNRRRLIELLSEQKQAIINQAVTRGLDPSVPLKPSGIDWLGDVPEHWIQRRLKFLVRNVNEQTNSKLQDDVYIALEHVESWTGRIALPNDVAFDSQVKRFQPNDVLFGKLRPYLAKVTRSQMNGVCVSEFLVLRTADASIRPEFLEQKLRSKQLIDLINSSTFGAKMPRADWTFIGNVMIAYPPTHDEQQAILGRTSEQTVALSSAIERAQREIDLIREYRTRLIADVVTGKLDVRHLAPPPDNLDTDELTVLDADKGFDDELPEDDAELVEEVTNADD